MFANEPETIAIARSLVGVADTTTAGWAAELVRTETRALLQEDLVPMSIWANLASQGLSLSFNGANSVVVPQMNVGITADGAWVGEGGAIPLVKGNLTAKRLSRYKLGGIVPITKELQRTSDPAAVEVMRRLLMRVISNLLDSSLISALAENPGVRPAGIMFGVVTTPGAAGGGIAAVIADLKTMVGKFIAANVGSKPVLLMNSMTKLSLGLMTNALGQFFLSTEAAASLPPIIASPIVPAGTVILVDADAFASAFDDMEIDISESATVQMANSDAVAPTHAGAGPLGGALGVAHEVPVDGGIPISGGNGASIAGSVAISFWQTWSLGIRLVMPASFGITKAGAVQGVTGVTW
jgi:HK97 family phage major capsid protein